MKRMKLKKRTARKLFTRTAVRTNRKNITRPRIMRGGYRL